MGPTPTGAQHTIPLDDVFFSTTDTKGVIDEANEVFRRNARHSRDELIGAPHNVIRHPDMPGAVFKVMWDMLAAGTPVCAYVLNLAGDGSAYWAFATVVPIGDRYLSVRTGPCNVEARDLVHSLYRAVRAAEHQAREAGAAAREAAEAGVEVLSAALADNGFASYADFQADLVPVEVAAREACGPTLPEAADAPPRVRVLLADVSALRSRLTDFSGSLSASLVATEEVSRDARRCAAGLGSVRESLRALADSGGAQAVDAGSLDHRLSASAQEMGEIQQRLLAVVRARKQVTLSTAIARLQAEAIARYVIAAAEGVEDPAVSHRALTSLTEALFAILEADITADIATLRTFQTRVAEAVARVRALGDEVAGLESTPRQLGLDLDSLAAVTDRLASGAASLGEVSVELDRATLAQLLAQIVERSAAI